MEKHKAAVSKTGQVICVACGGIIVGQFGSSFSGTAAAWVALLCGFVLLGLNFFLLFRSFWRPNG
jgi:hypothetical protein